MGKPAVGLGAAPILFGTVCLTVVSTIIYVHHNQKSEKEVGLMVSCLIALLWLKFMYPANSRSTSTKDSKTRSKSYIKPTTSRKFYTAVHPGSKTYCCNYQDDVIWKKTGGRKYC